MDTTPKEFKPLLAELQKIREHLETLRKELGKTNAAIGNAANTYQQEQHKLPIPFEVKLEKDQEGKRETESGRQYELQKSVRKATWATFVVTLGAFLAAGVYAYLAKRQWGEMIAARHQAQAGITAAIDAATEARNANTYTVAANRPWIGQQFQANNPINFIPSHNGQYSWTNVTYQFHFKNSGRRPALIERVETVGECRKECTESPDYNHVGKSCGADIIAASSPQFVVGDGNGGSRSLTMPDGELQSVLGIPILQDKFDQITGHPPTLQYCAYFRIEYRDVIYPKELHHTQGCRVFIPGMGLGHCKNRFDEAN